jgi:hypothetical protein
MIHMKAQWVHREIHNMFGDVCGKAAHSEPIVDPHEFARLPDIARCPHCVWFLHDDMCHGQENSIFHALCPVGRHLTTVCGKSVGINEISLSEFRLLPHERKCEKCAELVRSFK